MRVATLFKPAFLILVPVLASFVLWAVPGTGTYLRGFASRSDLNPASLSILIIWYAVCVGVVIAGAHTGRSTPRLTTLEPSSNENNFERTFYWVITLMSAVGVGWSYVSVGGQFSIGTVVSSGQANLLSSALGDGSSLATLRYSAIVAAPLAVWRTYTRRAGWPLAILNVVLLLGVALLSSRLSIIMATVVFIFLLWRERPTAQFRLSWLIAGGAFLFALLAVFNYTRNSNFYRLLGVENPIAMNAYQILAYVGTPTQVAVGVADGMFRGAISGNETFESAAVVLVPTFLQTVKSDKSAALDPALYNYQVDVAPNLNANSAFADTFANYGYWGLLLTLVGLFFAGLIYGHFLQYKSYVSTVSAVIAYGLLEYWRGFLFLQGIIVFLIVSVVIAAFVASALTPPARDHPQHARSRTLARGFAGSSS